MKRYIIIFLYLFFATEVFAISNYTYIYPSDSITVATSTENGSTVLSIDFYTFTATSTILSGTLHSSNLGNGANLYVVSDSSLFRYVDRQNGDLETYKLAIYPYLVKPGNKLRCEKDNSLRFAHCRVVFVPYDIIKSSINTVDLSTTTISLISGSSTISGTSTGNYNGPTFQEWLFVSGIMIFFLSFVAWGRIFRPIKEMQ